MAGPFARSALPEVHATTSLSVPGRRIGTQLLRGAATSGALPSHRRQVPTFHTDASHEARAASLPVTTRSVNRLPPSSSSGPNSNTPVLMTSTPFDSSSAVHLRSPASRSPDGMVSRLFQLVHHPPHCRRHSSWWFGPKSCNPSPRGRPSSSVQHAHQSRLHAHLLIRTSWHTEMGGFELIWRIAPRAAIHAVAMSPDDPFFWTAARDATQSVLSVCYKEKKKCPYRSSVSSKARRYPDFIRKNSPNPNEFAQFAFNLLMRPDDHATKSRSSRAVSFHTVSRSG